MYVIVVIVLCEYDQGIDWNTAEKIKHAHTSIKILLE